MQSGIDSADNFVFILSPDSVVSEPCMQELAHAITNGKRLIPICYRKPDQSRVPAALAPINYIFFDDPGRFDAALNTLIAAMHTDLAWVRSHTRLQVRALEWQAKNSDRSYLLGGSDLKDAESWLARAASQPIKPTDLQSQYILASRAAATRAQRRNLTIAIGVAIVASALAVIAIIQYFAAKRQTVIANKATAAETVQRKEADRQRAEADRQRDAAEHETKIATSGRLAATAISLKDTQLDLGSLLSLEAARIEPTFDSLNAQVTLFQSSPDLIAYLHQPSKLGTNLESVAFSPNGERFATSTFAGEITLWNTHTLLPVKTFSTSSRGVAMLPRLVFGHDALTLAMADEGDSVVQVWKIAGARAALMKPEPSGAPANPAYIALGPDGRLLAAGGSNGVQVWNLSAPDSPLRKLALKDWPYIYGLAFSPGNGSILAAAFKDTIRFEDPVTGSSRGEIDFTSPQTGGRRQNATDDSVRSGALVISSDGTQLAVGQGHPVNREGKEINADGTQPAFGRGHGSVALWRLHDAGGNISGTLRGTLPLGDNGHTAALAFRPDGKELVTASEEGSMRRWDADSLQLIREYPQPLLQKISSVAFSPDGAMLLCAPTKDVFFLFSDTDLTLHPAVPSDYPKISATTAVLPSSAPEVTVTSHSGVSARITAKGVEVSTRNPPLLLSNDDVFDQVAISPNGLFVAASSTNSTFPPSRRLWDLSQPVPREVPLANNDGDGHVLAFAPAGDILAIGGDNGISLWDAKTGRLVAANLDKNRRQIQSIVFSPGFNLDTGRIAIVLEGGAVWLLDGATLRQLGTPIVPATGVPYDAPSSAAFSKDGHSLFIRNGSDHTVLKWDADPASWAARACRVANRNLSLDEWKRYIGDTIPYHRTCPQFPDGEGVTK